MVIRRRTLLLAGAASAVPSWAHGQCVTDTVAVDACKGGVYVGGAPSLDLNFTGDTLDPRITFTRAAGPATYFDAAGVLQTAGTNVPRFDYDPVTHAPRGLLIEEARTNLLLQSKFASSWTTTSAVLTPNSVLSLDGGITAATLREDSTTGVHLVGQTQTKAASALTYAVSILAKAGVGTRNIEIQIDSVLSNGVNTIVNPTTGAIIQSALAFGPAGWAVASPTTCTPMGNGWWRISFAATSDATANLRLLALTTNGLITSYAGDNTSSILIDGFQVEAGAFPTSYIPSTTAAATRAADVATMPTGPWFNATQGTLAVDGILPQISPANQDIWGIDDGSGNNLYAVRAPAGTANIVATAFSANVLQPQATTANTYIIGAPLKAAMTYNAGALAVCLNGGAVATASGAAPIGLSRVNLGTLRVAPQNGTKARIRYWSRALSATELQAATT